MRGMQRSATPKSSWLVTVVSVRLKFVDDYKELEPEDSPDSTHGIVVSSLSRAGHPNEQLSLWDFGGQDIYHGTHALFMRTRAIFLVVWSQDGELNETHEYGGFTFRNHRLPYWLTHVRHLGKADSPLLVIQNKCDHPGDESQHPPANQAHFDRFDHCRLLQYSATENRNRSALDEALDEAINQLHTSAGTFEIGIGRLEIRRQLEEWRDQDAPRPIAERRYRTIDMPIFVELCQSNGKVSSPRHLLEYLHNAGVVFYREGLFNDQIILDQAWALNAIYAVLGSSAIVRPDSRHARTIHSQHARASRWSKYSDEEQKLFIDMMQSCGICFEHSAGDDGRRIEAEYVAPDLLPSREINRKRSTQSGTMKPKNDKSRLSIRSFIRPLLRSIVAAIGRKASTRRCIGIRSVCLREFHRLSIV